MEDEIIYRPYRIYAGKKRNTKYMKIKNVKIKPKRIFKKMIRKTNETLSMKDINNATAGYFKNIKDSYIGKFRDIQNLHNVGNTIMTLNFLSQIKKELQDEKKEILDTEAKIITKVSDLDNKEKLTDEKIKKINNEMSNVNKILKITPTLGESFFSDNINTIFTNNDRLEEEKDNKTGTFGLDMPPHLVRGFISESPYLEELKKQYSQPKGPESTKNLEKKPRFARFGHFKMGPENILDELNNLDSEIANEKIANEKSAHDSSEYISLESSPHVSVDSDKDESEERGGGRKYRGLFNDEIDRFMAPIRKLINYYGTVSYDEIPEIFNKINTKVFSLIFNKAKINDPPSKQHHWCAIYSDGCSVEIYDPLGDKIPEELINFIHKFMNEHSNIYLKLKTNHNRPDQGSSSNCGWYAMRFLIARGIFKVPFDKITGFRGIRKHEENIKGMKENFEMFGFI